MGRGKTGEGHGDPEGHVSRDLGVAHNDRSMEHS